MHILLTLRRYFFAALLLGGIFTTVACQESTDERFAREAEEYTAAQCPKRITPEVILDSMVYDTQQQNMQYYYTLSGRLDDASHVTRTKEEFRQALLEGIINAIELKKSKDEGINFVYIYRSAKSGKTLLKTVFTKDDYQPRETTK